MATENTREPTSGGRNRWGMGLDMALFRSWHDSCYACAYASRVKKVWAENPSENTSHRGTEKDDARRPRNTDICLRGHGRPVVGRGPGGISIYRVAPERRTTGLSSGPRPVLGPESRYISISVGREMGIIPRVSHPPHIFFSKKIKKKKTGGTGWTTPRHVAPCCEYPSRNSWGPSRLYIVSHRTDIERT